MRKKFFKISVIGLILITAMIVISNSIIISNAKGKTFNNLSDIKKSKVGLLLGANKYLANGNVNLYYNYRLNAAIQLYNSDKIEYILVSGDNGSKHYDEPTVFKEDLLKACIPEHRIVLDYAGFRTLDSVIRAKEIFGQDELIIISQKFHNERAIYLAEHHAIKAIAYNAKDVSGRSGLRTNLREYLAKTKAVIDIMIGTNPKFLGDKIAIK